MIKFKCRPQERDTPSKELLFRCMSELNLAFLCA